MCVGWFIFIWLYATRMNYGSSHAFILLDPRDCFPPGWEPNPQFKDSSTDWLPWLGVGFEDLNNRLFRLQAFASAHLIM